MELLPIVSMEVSKISCLVIGIGFVVWGIYVHYVEHKRKTASRQK